MAFWILIGLLFIFHGPYFHFFGFIHAKNVNSVCWQIWIFTYACALIFVHRRFGSLFWLLGVLIGSLFHKKKWVLIGSLSQSLGVFISFRGSANAKTQQELNLRRYELIGFQHFPGSGYDPRM